MHSVIWTLQPTKFGTLHPTLHGLHIVVCMDSVYLVKYCLSRGTFTDHELERNCGVILIHLLGAVLGALYPGSQHAQCYVQSEPVMTIYLWDLIL